MRIAICVKQVPASADIMIDRLTNQLRRDKTAVELNSLDRNALELALELMDTKDATITAFTMGPPQARAVLKTCMALGAQRGYLVCDGAAAGSDTYATAQILAQAIRYDEAINGPFDLVLCGRSSSDGDTAQVGPELAEQLGMTQITAIEDIIEVDGSSVMAAMVCEDEVLHIRAMLPAVLTVGKIGKELRYATIKGVIRANRQLELVTLSLKDLPGVELDMVGLEGSPTMTTDIFTPKTDDKVSFIQGRSIEEKAKNTAEVLISALSI